VRHPVPRTTPPVFPFLMSTYSFVTVNAFTPNTFGQPNNPWTAVGLTNPWTQQGTVFTTTTLDGGLPIVLSFLSPSCFRVRFSPVPGALASTPDGSYAVVTQNLGPVNFSSVTQSATQLIVDTGVIRVVVNLNGYFVTVYRSGTNQLIHSDAPGSGLIYIPGQEVVANLKQYPQNALYVGFGEKAGTSLAKNQFTMTNFNFDNFMYSNSFVDGSGPLPAGEIPGPGNPSEPLYNSVPLLIEINPQPVGANSGAPYAYGLFFDNVAQSYYNIGTNDYSDMSGKYYVGALYGFMDYYFMAGNAAPDVVDQFTQLTGRPILPPKYALGFHQGCYGYYDRYKLAQAANSFRAARIPCDGLHIDVDFQNNYRTFTHSEMKFPNAKEMFQNLKTIGFKCSTNITALITANPYDEYGNTNTPYPARDSGFAQNAFIYNTQNDGPPNPYLFLGNEGYGDNAGSNPYPYPPLVPLNGVTTLGSYGYYPDLGDPAVQTWWGQQYKDILDLGIEMIWQDMTDPALEPGNGATIQIAQPGGNIGSYNNNTPANEKTFPLGLMLYDTVSGTYQAHARLKNSFVMNLLKATTGGLQTLRAGLRTFIIARGGYAGMQRYAGLWTGDSASSWQFLQANIPEVLNNGLSGQPISGCDIGGFANGSGTTSASYVTDGTVFGGITDYELLTRWMTMGALLPWFRNHYDGYTKQFQEPYAYGEPVPAICRTWVEIRYTLLQLFYDCAYQASQTGMPICRALFLNDPQDPACYQSPGIADSQFYVGHDLLVAPILAPEAEGGGVREVYLPAGSQWYGFQNNQAPLGPLTPGGQSYSYTATFAGDPLYYVPVYVRAGAIIPTRVLEQWVGQLAQCPLTFNIYPGPDSSYQLYQDDGLTTAAQTNGAYRLTTISHTGISGGQSVNVVRTYENPAFTPKETFYYVAFLGTNQPATLTVAGASVPNLIYPTPEQAADALAVYDGNAYYYNAGIKTTFVKVMDTSSNVTVVATF
jgi:alpha-glucosidase